MLCKVISGTYYAKGNLYYTVPSSKYNTSITPFSFTHPKIIDFEVLQKWDSTLYFSFSDGQYWYWRDYTINDIWHYSYSFGGFSRNPVTFSSTYIRWNNGTLITWNDVPDFKFYDLVAELTVWIAIKQVYVREVKRIGKKTTITIFGKHIDNTRILDENSFTDSDKIKYCKTKGTRHSVSSTSYTAIGYGYIVYTGGNGSNVAEIRINGNTVAYCNSSYMSGIQFFKPGDSLMLSNLTNKEMYDFY